ncbi:hypothetical protein MRX96_015823 [Rhipicephalus microplus]
MIIGRLQAWPTTHGYIYAAVPSADAHNQASGYEGPSLQIALPPANIAHSSGTLCKLRAPIGGAACGASLHQALLRARRASRRARSAVPYLKATF